MRIDILTIFPDMFEAVLGCSILKRARERGAVTIRLRDIRDYTHDRHHSVDDKPYGGGAGMVMKAAPIAEALEAVLGKGRASRKSHRRSARGSRVILMSPQGRRFDQKTARRLARCGQIVLISGHYEGVDERVRLAFADEEISIGDYILTGGELPAMVVVDAVVRLLPGVLGNRESKADESFENGLLEYPQYTRPSSFRGYKVPRVLMSGDHNKIEEWRRRESVKRTRTKRPDLVERVR